VPVSVTQISVYWRRHVALARALLIDTGVGGLDSKSAAVRHRIPGIDAQVEIALKADGSQKVPAKGR
jgi:hypothetical protein